MEKEKEELYEELKELDSHIKQLNKHLESMDAQITEVTSTKEIVQKFKELNVGDELRVPLSSGVYVKATLSDASTMMINVGSSVNTEKTPDEVLDIMNSQLAELSSYRDNLVSNMKELIIRVDEIQKHFS